LRLVVEKGGRTVSVDELWMLERFAGVALLDQRGMLLQTLEGVGGICCRGWCTVEEGADSCHE